MAEGAFSRTEKLLGHENMERLSKARVAVFGVGGVGGYAVEALIRSGVGALDLIDSDTVAESNLNRQIIATRETVGMLKVDVAKARCLSINPDAVIRTYPCFYLPETRDRFDFTQYDYVVDAIDTVTGKIGLVMQAQEAGTPIISSMGAGNKLDPTGFQVADIYETSVCPLAKVMRRELKKRGVKRLKVVYSREVAMTPLTDEEAGNMKETEAAGCGAMSDAPGKVSTEKKASSGEAVGITPRKRQSPGSTAFVPSVVGLIIAGEVIKDLTVNR